MRDWQFHALQQAELFALVDLWCQGTGELGDDGHMLQQCRSLIAAGIRVGTIVQVEQSLRRLLGLLLHMDVEETRGGLFERIRVEVGLHQVAGEFGVEQRLGQVDAEGCE